MEYVEHEIDEFCRFRVIEHECTVEGCKTCKESDESLYAWLFNSDRYNPDRWVIAAVIPSDILNPFEDALETDERGQLIDLYGRMAAIFGCGWGLIDNRWHDVFVRNHELLAKVNTNNALIDQLSRLEAIHVTKFKVPDLESSRVAYDRIRTLFAFPDLYKPNKKKKKKKDDPKKEDK